MKITDFFKALEPRKGQADASLSRDEFQKRAKEKFYDPSFDSVASARDAVIEKMWENFRDYHKSPRKRKAGEGYSDPDYELPIEWLETSEKLKKSEIIQKNPSTPDRVLLICGSPRNDQTCPGENSKTHRLCQIAQRVFEKQNLKVDYLDLSSLTSNYGRVIYPCKACVSTAMPLCHWPCSCYPNHAMAQVNDWMGEIYEKWVLAHGVLIVSPVHWYQVPSTLKLMMDRLVCADGGNPDQTTTKGKTPKIAKQIELDGWSYPRHLSGRVFSVIAHGDAAGVENVRDALSHWLEDMGLHSASHASNIGRYLGYYRPYATSHEDLDNDIAFQKEVENSANILSEAIKLMRSGTLNMLERMAKDPRPK